MGEILGQHYDLQRRSNNSPGIAGKVANGLGWFSIGLGVTELVAPGKVARLVGLEPSRKRNAVLRSYGLREMAAGIGILSQSQPSHWLWTRVAGDIVDLASLRRAHSGGDAGRGRLTAAAAAVAGITALDIYCGQKLSRSNGDRTSGRDVHTSKVLIINRNPEDIYQFWRNFENLPSFMTHLESVRPVGTGRSHWRAKGPGGTIVEWEAEIVADAPNSKIAWRSVPGSEIENSGRVRFDRAPGGRGTLVRVDLCYSPPGGRLGSSLAKLLGAEPGQQLDGALRALKQILETGEIVKSDASIHRGMHAAQPPGEEIRMTRREGSESPSFV